MSKQILLLSPYDALSHAHWRDGIISHLLAYRFQQVVLPPRYFSWRFRGNSLALAHDERLTGTHVDLILATSMTDLAGLKGMRPELASIPSILYFHENQFAYPGNDDTHLLDRQLTSLYSAIAANKLVFNSDYNRATFLDGVDQMLSRMPDHVPRGIVETLRGKSMVHPVPIEDACFQSRKKSGTFSIVWNHRWEYDKGPERLRATIEALLETDMAFSVHLLGQQFRKMPDDMQACIRMLQDHGALGQCGFIEDRQAYRRLLGESHLVLSTAHHEFQGLAVLEAVASGCTPVVPDEVVYRELFSSAYRYSDTVGAVNRIREHYQQWQKGEFRDVPDVAGMSWGQQKDSWTRLLGSLI